MADTKASTGVDAKDLDALKAAVPSMVWIQIENSSSNVTVKYKTNDSEADVVSIQVAPESSDGVKSLLDCVEALLLQNPPLLREFLLETPPGFTEDYSSAMAPFYPMCKKIGSATSLQLATIPGCIGSLQGLTANIDNPQTSLQRIRITKTTGYEGFICVDSRQQVWEVLLSAIAKSQLKELMLDLESFDEMTDGDNPTLLCKDLCATIQQCKTLEIFHIKAGPFWIGDAEESWWDDEELQHSLSNHPALTDFGIWTGNDDAPVGAAIGKAMAVNSKLRKLACRGMGGMDSLKPLFEGGLSQNTTLESLELDMSNYEGAAPIVNGLQNMASIAASIKGC